jgi:hypothetical protein
MIQWAEVHNCHEPQGPQIGLRSWTLLFDDAWYALLILAVVETSSHYVFKALHLDLLIQSCSRLVLLRFLLK